MNYMFCKYDDHQYNNESISLTSFPKLFVNADPGSILLDPARAFVRKWKNLTEVTVKGTHFIQEDSPHEIGTALKKWLEQINQS